MSQIDPYPIIRDSNVTCVVQITKGSSSKQTIPHIIGVNFLQANFSSVAFKIPSWLTANQTKNIRFRLVEGFEFKTEVWNKAKRLVNNG